MTTHGKKVFFILFPFPLMMMVGGWLVTQVEDRK